MKTNDAKEFLAAIDMIRQLTDFINAAAERYPAEMLDVYYTETDSENNPLKLCTAIDETTVCARPSFEMEKSVSVYEDNWVTGCSTTPREKIAYLNNLLWSGQTED